MTEYTTTEQQPDNNFSLPNLGSPSFYAESLTVLGIVGLACWKYYLQPKLQKLRTSFQRSLETDQQILGRLYIMLEKYNASRVLFYQAHNGTIYNSGQHQWKVSITHEVLAAGVSSVKHWSQNEPSADFITGHPDIVKQKAVLLKLHDPTLEDVPTTKHRFLNHGVVGLLSLVIPSYRDGDLIGFLAIHWMDESHVPAELKDLVGLEDDIEKIRGLFLKSSNNRLFEDLSKILWRS